jgi:hypothetical protein
MGLPGVIATPLPANQREQFETMPRPQYYKTPTKFQVSPAQVSKTCQYCQNEFWITRSCAEGVMYCNGNCRENAKRSKMAFKRASEMSQLADDAKKISTLIIDNRPIRQPINVLTPQYTSMLRGKIASIVHDHLLVAEKVLTGEIVWSNAQISLFKTLMSKVVPDVSATYHQHEMNSRSTESMTRDELEALASQQAAGVTIEGNKSPEGSPEDLDDASGVRPGHVRPGPTIHYTRQKAAYAYGPPGEDHDPEDP